MGLAQLKPVEMGTVKCEGGDTRHVTHWAVVCVFVNNDKGETLLFRHLKRNTIVVGGGGAELGETVLEAACREMMEEFGITVQPEDLRPAGMIERAIGVGKPQRMVQFYFTTNKWEGEPRNMEPGKHGDPVWYRLDDLPGDFHPLDRMIAENGFVPGLTVFKGEKA